VFLNYAYEQSWNIVSDNIIQKNNDGLYVHWVNNNEILDNIIKLNRDDGIEMESSRNTIISGNIIQENSKYGLYLRAASHGNIIKQNDFIDNENHAYFDGSLFNRWLRNYWSNSQWFIIKPIKGQIDIFDIPWIDFDLFPSLKENHL
jgi:parallel beta-helix repeat protein